MFKLETHLHTAEVSPCARVPAEDMVGLYKEAGYASIVVTDHLYQQQLDSFGCPDWASAMDRFLVGYHLAKRAGERLGLDVMLGAELEPDGSWNEYLLFGLTEEFLYRNEGLCQYDLVRLREACSEAGILIYQAHPYRPDMTRGMPGFLDGVEVYNACPRHDSRNEMALAFARNHHLGMTSGSDAHRPEDVGRGGLQTAERIVDLERLKVVLCDGSAELLRAPEDRPKKRGLFRRR